MAVVPKKKTSSPRIQLALNIIKKQRTDMDIAVKRKAEALLILCKMLLVMLGT
jgi:hypothetical protein